MSVIGSPIETSLLQAAQAQQAASKARDKEKAARDSSARRFQDVIELRVAGVENAEALRKLPPNDSEQAEQEHRRNDLPHHQEGADEDGKPRKPRIDIQA